MFTFFRRYQKIFFFVITVVIVISFSFFGTYNAFVSNPVRDGVAFVAIDGSRVYQSEFQDMVNFISADAIDERSGMQPYAGNGLNDGVIVNDIFANGLAVVIAKPFMSQIGPDLTQRFEREKLFAPYRHPHVPFINAELIWNYFAPDIKKNYDALMASSQPQSETAFNERVKLYVAERQFPTMYLKQLIRYQESQHESIQQDEQLLSRDLSLFGYHNIQDWFGKNYVELVAAFIINTAKYAESQGIKVSSDEALGSLYANARSTYHEQKLGQYFGITSPHEYFQMMVHRLGMDQGRAAHVWRWVLLARRLINEQKDSLLVDGLPFRDFYMHKNEYVDVELYSLPQEVSVRSLEDVEKLALYQQAVFGKSMTQVNESDDTIVFTRAVAASPEEVRRLYPDLVKQDYNLRYAAVNTSDLEGKIGLRKTWAWQVTDKGWQSLQKQFPEVAQLKATFPDTRHVALENLDAKTRSRVDAYSRAEIVKENPQWIIDALNSGEMRGGDVSLRGKGGKFPFQGIKDRESFFKLLNIAPLGSMGQALSCYTQDNIHYYKIEVVSRGSESVLSYEQALADDTLDSMLNMALDLTYQRLRKEKPSQYLESNGEWKPLAAVRKEVASAYFDELFQSLDQNIEMTKKEQPQITSWDDRDRNRAACRLLGYMKLAQKATKDSPEDAGKWNLVKKDVRVFHGAKNMDIDSVEPFSLEKHTWSKLHFSPQSGLVFYKVVGKGILDTQDDIRNKSLATKAFLSEKLAREIGEKLCAIMIEKNALVIETKAK